MASAESSFTIFLETSAGATLTGTSHSVPLSTFFTHSSTLRLVQYQACFENGNTNALGILIRINELLNNNNSVYNGSAAGTLFLPVYNDQQVTIHDCNVPLGNVQQNQHLTVEIAAIKTTPGDTAGNLETIMLTFAHQA